MRWSAELRSALQFLQVIGSYYYISLAVLYILWYHSRYAHTQFPFSRATTMRPWISMSLLSISTHRKGFFERCICHIHTHKEKTFAWADTHTTDRHTPTDIEDHLTVCVPLLKVERSFAFEKVVADPQSSVSDVDTAGKTRTSAHSSCR